MGGGAVHPLDRRPPKTTAVTSLAARVLDHLATTILPWRHPPVTQLTAPTTCPDEVEAAPPVADTSGYDPADDLQPWVGLPDAGCWRPAGGRSLADEIDRAHRAQTRGGGAAAYHDPQPEVWVEPWTKPEGAT